MLGLWSGRVLEGETDDRSCALPLRIKAAISCCKEICTQQLHHSPQVVLVAVMLSSTDDAK